MKTICAVLLLACAPFAFAADFPNPTYERVLIPVFISGPGAQGAQWETSVTITSTAEETVELARPALLYHQDRFCDLACAKRSLIPLAAVGVSRHLEHPAGLLLWVPRSMARGELNANIRVWDTARNATSAGTYVPLVREDDLSTGKNVLLDVPVGPGFRASLRLYDLYLEQIDFEVKIYDMEEYREGGAQPLVETFVTVTSDPRTSPEDFQYQQRPAFAFIGDLVAAYPELAGHDRVVIVAEGLHPIVSPPAYDKRFYALASVTNDATNEVTIIAPR
jgi:hypothetical protein